MDNIPISLINHNLHWNSIEQFSRQDPHLFALSQARYVHNFSCDIQLEQPAVHILWGPRQLGKSTFLKMLVLRLLKGNVPPRSACYIACDGVVTLERFEQIVRSFSQSVSDFQISYLFLDEVQFIKGWAGLFKALLDEGLLRSSVVIITGSDASVLKEAKATFPGKHRRSLYAKDIELYPLNFREFVQISGGSVSNEQEKSELFDLYLLSGGFPLTINEVLCSKKLPKSIYAIYQDWIIGDFLRKDKNKEQLYATLCAIVKTLGSQISFNSLHRHVDRGALTTTIEYVELLEQIGVIQIVSALDQNALGPAPKKAKKIHFTDPFLVSVILNLLKDLQRIGDDFNIDTSILVEGVVTTYMRRTFPTYYIKAEGEVDIAVVKSGNFIPIEVKWTEQTRSQDLKQLLKYPNGIVLRKSGATARKDSVRYMNLLDTLMEADFRWLE